MHSAPSLVAWGLFVIAVVGIPRWETRWQRRHVRPTWMALRYRAFAVPAAPTIWRFGVAACGLVAMVLWGLFASGGLRSLEFLIGTPLWGIAFLLAIVPALTRYPVTLTPDGVTTRRLVRRTAVSWDELATRVEARSELGIFSGWHSIGMPGATIDHLVRHYARTPSARASIGTSGGYDRLEAIVAASVAAAPKQHVPQPPGPTWDPWHERDEIGS